MSNESSGWEESTRHEYPLSYVGGIIINSTFANYVKWTIFHRSIRLLHKNQILNIQKSIFMNSCRVRCSISCAFTIESQSQLVIFNAIECSLAVNWSYQPRMIYKQAKSMLYIRTYYELMLNHAHLLTTITIIRWRKKSSHINGIDNAMNVWAWFLTIYSQWINVYCHWSKSTDADYFSRK